MAPGGAPPQQQDNSLGPLWIMVGLCIALALIWMAFHTYIMKAFIKVKLFEISLVKIFTHNLDAQELQLLEMDPSTATWASAHQVASSVGLYIAVPVAVFMLVIAYIIFSGNNAKAYRKIYSMDSLASAEQDLWPQIKPVLGEDLHKQPLEEGRWAMSLTPMNFAKRKRLIIEEEAPPVEGTYSRGKRIVARLDRGKANALFSLQLGGIWQGVEKLPEHQAALFGAFAARANGDRQVCDDLLNQISNSYDREKNTADFSGGRELCAKYINTKAVKRVTNSHAYSLTVMASMLELARYDGVFATADFLWLKPVDRGCWFLLNSVGRRTPVPESAGPFSHWLAEKELGRRAILPMVESATDALELALTEIIYHPDED